jgi:hypothetical protein
MIGTHHHAQLVLIEVESHKVFFFFLPRLAWNLHPLDLNLQSSYLTHNHLLPSLYYYSLSHINIQTSPLSAAEYTPRSPWIILNIVIRWQLLWQPRW